MVAIEECSLLRRLGYQLLMQVRFPEHILSEQGHLLGITRPSSGCVHTACTSVCGHVCCAQVHDEVILEGPARHAWKARKLVEYHMRNPWRRFMNSHKVEMPLRVKLEVDCNSAPTWYEAK
jgi:hypothetical protein